MPELPEMETYRQLLIPLVQYAVVQQVQVARPKSVNVEPERLEAELVGRQIMGIERKAKHLLFHLSSEKVLLLHLMLGGMMFYGTEEQRPNRTAQVVLRFGSRNLYFFGLRLGYLHLHTRSEIERLLSKLGPEPLDPVFSFARFQQQLQAKKGNLKAILVDQSFLSGIGNCYSDEICFYAGIVPTRKAHTLNDDEQMRLFMSMQAVLNEAIHYGGYMEMPLFAGDRLTGQFDQRCRVYDREGKLCVRCGSLVVKQEVSSKKCFFCPSCQR